MYRGAGEGGATGCTQISRVRFTPRIEVTAARATDGGARGAEVEEASASLLAASEVDRETDSAMADEPERERQRKRERESAGQIEEGRPRDVATWRMMMSVGRGSRTNQQKRP